MTDNERDTHFLGFADLLWDDIQTIFPEYVISSWTYTANSDEDERIKQLIAQRAYDLVYHSLDNVWEIHNPIVLIEKIPDLTEWPPTQ